jgi:hypothetical protein
MQTCWQGWNHTVFIALGHPNLCAMSVRAHSAWHVELSNRATIYRSASEKREDGSLRVHRQDYSAKAQAHRL